VIICSEDTEGQFAQHQCGLKNQQNKNQVCRTAILVESINSDNSYLTLIFEPSALSKHPPGSL
jgi:hypothetical protein